MTRMDTSSISWSITSHTMFGARGWINNGKNRLAKASNKTVERKRCSTVLASMPPHLHTLDKPRRFLRQLLIRHFRATTLFYRRIQGGPETAPRRGELEGARQWTDRGLVPAIAHVKIGQLRHRVDVGRLFLEVLHE